MTQLGDNVLCVRTMETGRHGKERRSSPLPDDPFRKAWVQANLRGSGDSHHGFKTGIEKFRAIPTEDAIIKAISKRWTNV